MESDLTIVGTLGKPQEMKSNEDSRVGGLLVQTYFQLFPRMRSVTQRIEKETVNFKLSSVNILSMNL